MSLYREQYFDIDLVLLDVQMSGLVGPQTLAELRKLNPHVRCSFMSGYTGKYSTTDLQSAGARSVLMKTFRIGELDMSLRGLLDASPATRSQAVG